MAYTTINKSTDYHGTMLWSGNNSTQTVTFAAYNGSAQFQPDWTWIKKRNGANGFNMYDAIRGATKTINTASTAAESTAGSGLTAFNSDGFVLGSDGDVNGSGGTYVGWNWKAGTGAGSSNTDGTINSTYTSANTTAGFSIVQYTGNGSTNQTVGHGLGAVPDFIIIKQTNTTRNWPTYSKAMGNGVAFLDITDAWNGGSGYTNYWYPSGMTSTTFGISNNDNNNQSGGTFIAYVFSAKTGYSKFGKYRGNGSADGTFIYTGFKPAFFLIKGTSNTESWIMWDNKRRNGANQSFNPQDGRLLSNANNVEADADIDFLSNGFKLRATGAAWNGSGVNYIYMAFAESPFVANDSGTAVPVVAR